MLKKSFQHKVFTVPRVHGFRSPAFSACPHDANGTLHQVGLRDIKNWLWTRAPVAGWWWGGEISPAEPLRSNKIPSWGVLVWDTQPLLLILWNWHPWSWILPGTKIGAASHNENQIAVELQRGASKFIFLCPKPLSPRMLCESRRNQTNESTRAQSIQSRSLGSFYFPTFTVSLLSFLCLSILSHLIVCPAIKNAFRNSEGYKLSE